jgi:hypothetical protein
MKPDTTKNRGYRYVKLKALQIANRFEFEEMADLCKYTELHNLKEMFVLLNTSSEVEHFAIMHNNSLMQYGAQGYKTIEDYNSAKLNAFPDASSFYDAVSKGYDCYADYLMVLEAGINDKTLFDKIKNGGFVTGFNDYTKESNSATVSDTPANPYQLYQLAAQCGYDDYTGFKQAMDKGFTDKETYDLATSYGFSCYADYTDAKQRGFKKYEELAEANKYNIRDVKEMGLRNNLLSVQCTGCAFDEKLLLVLLSKLQQGKKISINKLGDLFNKSLDEYKDAQTNELLAWFTTSFTDTTSIIQFLCNNEEVKSFGHYDVDGEYFETKLLQQRKVVLDGSNVAHNSHGEKDRKANLENIIAVATYLKNKGFTDVSVIADASLKHKLTDGERIDELKTLTTYLEAPAGIAADVFLLHYVKNTGCLLVSNDTFRDWKMKDPWVAANVDFYRLSFMIKDNQVLMPDVK